MKLTGKCKEDFEEWTFPKDDLGLSEFEIIEFWNLPDSMQFGVIQDYADSVGYYKTTIQRVNGGFQLYDGSYFKTRPEARTEAVEQFNTKHNETNRN